MGGFRLWGRVGRFQKIVRCCCIADMRATIFGIGRNAVSLVKLSNDPRYFAVDEADLPLVFRRLWHFNAGYVRAVVNRKIIGLHTYLLGTPPEGLEVDHIDRDTLNNQRANLRWVTPTVNLRNRNLQRNNTSGFRGVCWSKKAGKWSAQIKVNGKLVNLGYFESLKAAAVVRSEAEIKLWKEA